MKLSLIILAAGAGSRFGGKKQIEPVGPEGQFLFEYSVYDALCAGFNHLVFVIDESLDCQEIANRIRAQSTAVRLDFVVQNPVAYSGIYTQQARNRCKPWGTAHAVLVTKSVINNMFAVINADDFYAGPTFALIAQHLLAHKEDGLAGVMPGYALAHTLSESGGVNRGICSTDGKGILSSIEEVWNISRDSHGVFSGNSSNGAFELNDESIASMTFWGFHPSSFSWFEDRFYAFLADNADSSDAEFYIPAAVDYAINSGLLNVSVLPTDEIWMGMTYRADLGRLKQQLQSMTEHGLYPIHLAD